MKRTNTFIRHATPTDLPYLYEICHQTGYQGKDASCHLLDRLLVGHLFVAPYIMWKPNWCWVVINNGLPVGYMVTVPDSISYYTWREINWMPTVREYYPERAHPDYPPFENILREIVHEPAEVPSFIKEYPAHIHIDLLPSFQRQGYGRQLFQKFHQKCHEHQVTGVHIGVSKFNTDAMKFYPEVGYTALQEEIWGTFFGAKLLAPE